MTWPFENDTSAVVKKLTKRSILADKKSNLLLIVTIALSVCMVLSLALSTKGIAEAQKDSYRDKAQITVVAPTEEQLAQIKNNSNVQWIGEYLFLGSSYQDNIELGISYANADYIEKERGLVYSGNIYILLLLLSVEFIFHIMVELNQSKHLPPQRGKEKNR